MPDIIIMGKTAQFYNLNDEIILVDELSKGAIYMYKMDYSATQLTLLYSFDSSFFSVSPASPFVTFQVL